MLSITVSVGHRVVAKATAANVSNLADISNYQVEAIEHGYSPLDIPHARISGMIWRHQRRSSVWRLVKKVADLASAEQE